MTLTNVVQDDTMAVPGFAHQTFMCSQCHDVERRFVFTKQDRDHDGEPMFEQASPSVAPASIVQEEQFAASDLLPIDPAEKVLVESTQIAPLDLTQTTPVATIVQVESTRMQATIENRDADPMLQHAPTPVLPASTAQDEQVVASGLLSNAQETRETVSAEPIQAARFEVSQTAAAPVQATETLAVETPTIQNRQSAWAEMLENLHTLEERKVTPRGAADEVERRAQFNHFWDGLLSIPSPSTSSEELSRVKADHPVASTNPTARDEPSCGVTLAQLADRVIPDTEHAGIANSFKQLSPASETSSNATPDEPVQSPNEPIASPAPTARDEPSGPEERRQRPRRWWSWRELVR